VYACARARACVRARVRVYAEAQACVRRRRRRRAYGGGRASMGKRACLRFERVLHRPVGELGGGLQGRLFAGNDMIAERG